MIRLQSRPDPAQALQGLTGHESIETTARYAEYTRARRGLDQMRRFRLGL